MLTSNRSGFRCLVLSTSHKAVEFLRTILPGMNFKTDFVQTRKEALRLFLQSKHTLLCVDAEFLPRFPYRLEQLFKIAHRTPAVLILNHSEKNILGFKFLKECVIDVVPEPLEQNRLSQVLNDVVQKSRKRTHRQFYKQVSVLAGVMIPLFILLLYLYYIR